jgi:DNA-binding GntR family transcriptional regulator
MASPVPIPRLRRSTLGEDVYEALKALVMEHTLAPGDRINIDALARELDVSPTPVREGLARLESDGLVRKRALVGYTVSPLLTRAEFTDMFDMRLVLEGAAARWAAQRASAEIAANIVGEAEATIEATIDATIDAAVDATVDATVGLDEATARVAATVDATADATLGLDEAGGHSWRSHAAFTALDARFHDLVAEAAGNPLLRDSIGRLHSHLHLHRLYFPYAQTGTTMQEHQLIGAAILARNPDAAEVAMREHLTMARERHLPAFD